MANKKNRCVVCDKEYDVCRLCPTEVQFTPWRVLCDTMTHYKIHMLLSEYNTGVISKEDAFEYLTQLKLSKDEIAELKPNIQKTVKEILRYKKPVTKKVIKESDNLESIMEEEIEE